MRCREAAAQRKARLAQLRKQAEQLIVVKSSNVGRHRTVRLLGDISSAAQHRSLGAAESDLRLQAAELGANAILSYYYETSRGSEPSYSGYGTHYFTVFRAYGRAAIVEPSTKDGEHKQDGTRTHSLRAGPRDEAYYLQVLGLPPAATADDIRTGVPTACEGVSSRPCFPSRTGASGSGGAQDEGD